MYLTMKRNSFKKNRWQTKTDDSSIVENVHSFTRRNSRVFDRKQSSRMVGMYVFRLKLGRRRANGASSFFPFSLSFYLFIYFLFFNPANPREKNSGVFAGTQVQHVLIKSPPFNCQAFLLRFASHIRNGRRAALAFSQNDFADGTNAQEEI